MWYMHGGAPAYFSRAVRDVLSNTYHDRWIGRGGPTAWPPHSPDLNPLDFYLWRHLKSLVYAAPVDNEETLHHHIVDACQTIRNYPGIFERMRQPMMRRVEAGIESCGGHFGHLLQMYSFSCNSQIKCFRTHVVTDIFSCFGIRMELVPKVRPHHSVTPCIYTHTRTYVSATALRRLGDRCAALRILNFDI
jgi:hypothetical protein